MTTNIVTKPTFSTQGDCLVPAHYYNGFIHDHPKKGVDIKEGDLKDPREEASIVLKVVDAYLVSNLEAYAGSDFYEAALHNYN